MPRTITFEVLIEVEDNANLNAEFDQLLAELEDKARQQDFVIDIFEAEWREDY